MANRELPYKVFGEFLLPRSNRGAVSSSREDHNAFWEEVEEDHPGLSDARGCYVFSLRNKAWYIGMTEASFRKECFQHHKLVRYRDAQDQAIGPARPSMFFVARTTLSGRFSTKRAKKEFEYVEHLLIGWALRRNSNLTNRKGTSFLSRLQIPGLLNTTQGTGNATTKALRLALGR